MLHLGAVTYNLLKDWDLDTIIQTLDQLGWEAVELRTEHKHGVETTLAVEVEPSVEDLFVSFVDKERKGRVREQLRAVAEGRA